MSEVILFIALLLGQVGRIQITQDIAVTVQDVAVLAYLLFHIRQLLKHMYKNLYFFFPFLSIFLVCIVSLAFNLWRYSEQQLFVGVMYFMRFVLYWKLYMVVRHGNKPLRYWFKWLYLLGIGYACIGLLQLVLYPNLRNLQYLGWDPHYYRLFSTLFDPNFAGILLVLSGIVGIYLWQKEKGQRLLILTGELLLLIAILFTYSRSTYVAVIAAAFLYMGIYKQWKWIIGIIGFGILIVFFPKIGGISTTITRLWSVYGRIANWQEGMQLFWQTPVIGYGFNMLRAIQRSSMESIYGYVSHATGGVDNSLLFILMTTGFSGLFAFGYMAYSQLKLLTVLKKRQQLKSICLSVFLAIFVHGMFVNSWFYPTVFLWIWVFLGAVEKEASS